MKVFYGRKNEINKINERINSDKFENILVTGRRRIGKTSLLLKVLNEYEGIKIYYSATEGSFSRNIESLWISISKVFNIKFKLNDIEDILDFLFEKSVEEKILLIIDEYSHLSSDFKPLNSILQNYIDKYHQSSKMKLIISGSYVKAMYELVSYDNPLYGRFTEQMVISDLNYLEVSEFYKNYSLEDKVRMYSIFGGNPFYNSFIDNKLNVEQNIKKNILDSQFILDSPIKIYLEEIKNIDGATFIFESISRGKHKYGDLSGDVILPTNLPYILDPLIEMGLIKKETPINMVNNKKKTFYYIEDNFLDFYYKYIHSNYSFFVNSNKDDFYDEFIKPTLETETFPKKFEKLCREAILYMNLNKLKNIKFINIGKYWYDDPKTKTNMEFDVTCLDSDKNFIFFEAKFSKNPINDSVVNKKEFQINNLKLDKYRLGFISKTGFDLKDKKDYILFDLQDLYLEK